MLRIESVQSGAMPLDQARALFREYNQFLRETKSCGTNPPDLDHETAALPIPYSGRNGEVLLALIHGVPAACIAYRAFARDPTGNTCEIKRLFVRPGFRGQNLARTLIADVLTRAAARNFTRAVLDTDVTTMAGAHALYLSLGFREYARDDHNLAFLEFALT